MIDLRRSRGEVRVTDLSAPFNASFGARCPFERRRPSEALTKEEIARCPMTQSEETVSVRVTRRFDASAERVYDAFLDPDTASRFMSMTATGQIVRCEIDARVGGAFAIVDRRDGEDVPHTGTFLELERPRRIVFTLSVEKHLSETSKVTIQIAPLGK
jgi:Activator of Hsp90 ATPase homolog 1-like protein